MATTTISETYTYTPLKGSTEVRLLTVHSGDEEDPLICSLSDSDLSNPPYFEALSYCWGLPNPTKHIILDGYQTEVRENLWSALWHLRNQRKNEVLWVDAICINQNDLSERNRQVRLMKDIYRKADRVVIWLGPEDEDSEIVMEYLKWMPSGTKERKRYTQQGGGSDHYVLRRAWRALCAREYWDRMWIIQECVHARSLKIKCGSEAVYDWNRFLNHPLRLHDSSERAFGAVMSLRGHQTVPENLIELIDRFIHRKCTDTRDTVYALLSMAPDQDSDRIQVDYGKTIVDVYCDVFELYAPSMATKHQFSWLSYPYSLGSKYAEDDFTIMLFSGILRKILHVESRSSFLDFEVLGLWTKEPSEESGWTDEEKVYEQSFGLQFLPFYDSAKRSVLRLCSDDTISEAVMVWLQDDCEPPPGDLISRRDLWPLQYPQSLRQLSKLQLFVGTFGQYSALRLELWKSQVIINVLRNPPGTRQRVVMERASGEFRVERSG